jgi:uncharacterized protein
MIPMAETENPDPAVRRNTSAVLLFVNTPALELRIRRWPAEFGRLLGMSRLLRVLADRDADVHVFVRGPWFGSREFGSTWHTQVGHGFGDRLQNAVSKIRAQYERIIIIGQDCPDLSLSDIEAALDLLEEGGIVLGPDHRGGTYLIGFFSWTAPRLDRVVWRSNTDCRELAAGYEPGKVVLLEERIDLDRIADLSLLARMRTAWSDLARGLLTLLESIPELPPLPLPSSRLFERTTWQLPPPAAR